MSVAIRESARAARMASFSPRRVYAMVLRYLYLLRGSWPRIIELIYWPSVQVILWGLISEFLRTNSSWVAQAGGVLIAAVLLWDVLFRSQLGVAVSFLEEVWARNLGQLFVTPLRPYELMAALAAMSMIRTLIGTIPAALLAIPLYSYSIFGMGLPLIAFFVNLMVFGWAIGLAVSGLILRYGLGAENLAWLAIFALAPLSGVYYPISILPHWIQPIAYALPSAYVFEGMRAVMFRHVFRTDLLWHAAALNALYLAIGAAVFLLFFGIVRRRGLLLQMGE
ncbi:MAG TPA: ABC transporter permease [Alphaproteobacteria bacterium]|nr:ABC transporter permease [Alphaproteobacteria bacterium]